MIPYSIIVPVYNRPDHIQSLLECLSKQTYKNFEVLIIESGSSIKSDKVVEQFKNDLDIRYIFKGNDGQGFSRNRGMKEAKGEFFIILDSDILMPEDYVEQVDKHLLKEGLDAYGGPDALHPDSTSFQKAVNYCMTSIFTTGGARGKKTSVGQYYPRSFNMGVSREVYEKIGGYNIPFKGEDLEWSHRIIKAGFKTGLIEKAPVFHERKKTLRTFYKQINFFGKSRINISKLVPGSFKTLHLLPIVYVAYVLMAAILTLTYPIHGKLLLLPFVIYNFLVISTATLKYKSFLVGWQSMIGTNALMLAYTTGMIKEYYNLYILKKEQTYKL